MEFQNNTIQRHKSAKFEEFDEPLAQPGKIFLAEIHGSAQRLLKIKKLSKYIRFCKCCLLPSETPGVVMPYTCLDSREDYGIGIQLYFFYIKFCIVITFIGLCLSSIPSMIFSSRYCSDLEKHCKLYYNDLNNTDHSNRSDNNIYPELITSDEHCIKYLSMDQNSEVQVDLADVVKSDWIVKFSADNTINYYYIFREHANDPDDITDILFHYSFIYFLTSIVLLIVNYFFIHYVDLLNDKEDFETTSPRDFTLLIHGVRRPTGNKLISKSQQLKNIVSEISRDYFKVEIHQIIPCFNLVNLYKLTKEVFEDRTKIYHTYNFKRQKDLHKEYIESQEKRSTKDQNNNNNNFFHSSLTELKYDTNDKNNMKNDNSSNIQIKSMGINYENTMNQLNQTDLEYFIHDSKLNYYSKFLGFIKATPLNQIENRISKNKKKIKEIEKDLEENPNNYSSGTYFIVFKYISMRDKFYNFFPTNTLTKIFMRIKYFFQNIIFGNCVNEKTKRTNYLKLAFAVEHATEAYEVQWENLGYSMCQKALYLSISIFVTIVLIGISLGIVLLLNYAQFNLTEKENDLEFVKYLLSFLISIIIAIINSVGRSLLKIVTNKFEAIETRTDYYISLSIKTTIFTFINTNIVPLISNYIQSQWGKNEILLNNILMIFIINFTLTPFIFYLGPDLIFKISRRAKARMDLEGIPLEDSIYTQGELNKIFENPSMNLSYKYSFLANNLLTSFFYMSVFPLGIVFSILGLILTYFLEIFYLGLYKRPELLNSRLCKYFINHFNIIVAVFCIGNYIFLRDFEKHCSINWSLINMILFIIIAFIPYHSIKVNLIGTSEGEVTKGSYGDYEMMFPTDYEKQNPLTRKNGMIKYFKRLEQLDLIDRIQSQTLIDNIKRESTMDSYYKTSKSVGNILTYYQFQNQFVKIKKKYKFIKEIRSKKRKLNNYDIYIKEKRRERRATLASRNSIHMGNNLRRLTKKIRTSSYEINNEINKNKNAEAQANVYNNKNDEESFLGYNKNYKIKGIMEDDPKKRRRVSQHMRKALFQTIKEEGIYSDTEEESEDESIESGDSIYESNSNSKSTESENNNNINNKNHNNDKTSENTQENNGETNKEINNQNENSNN